MTLSGSINVLHNSGVYGIVLNESGLVRWSYQHTLLLKLFLARFTEIVQAGR